MNKFSLYLRFISIAIIAHVTAYLIAGGLAYQFITKEFWEGSNPLLSAYLRTPGQAELWKHAMIWQIPSQIARAFLMAIVLLPLIDTLKNWKTGKLLLFYSALSFIYTHLASAVPSPANIEGFVYMKPEFINLGFIKMQPEMILHSILFAFILVKYGIKKTNIPSRKYKKKLLGEINEKKV